MSATRMSQGPPRPGEAPMFAQSRAGPREEPTGQRAQNPLLSTHQEPGDALGPGPAPAVKFTAA